MTAARAAGLSLAAMFSALAVASPALVMDEGWVTATYPDPILGDKVPTACGGITGAKYGITPGRVFTQDECIAITSRAYLDHALEVRGCLPADTLPTQIYAAFIRFTVNLGGPRACASTMFKKARAGDLSAACAEIPKWKFVGTREVLGLKLRRVRERAMCDAGLA